MNSKQHVMWGIRLGGGGVENLTLPEEPANGQHRPTQLFIDSETKRLKLAYRNSDDRIAYYTMADLESLDMEALEALDVERIAELNNGLTSLTQRMSSLEDGGALTAADVEQLILAATVGGEDGGEDGVQSAGQQIKDMLDRLAELETGGALTVYDVKVLIAEATDSDVEDVSGLITADTAATLVAEAIASYDEERKSKGFNIGSAEAYLQARGLI